MTYVIREMVVEDHDRCFRLWAETEHLHRDESDERAAVDRYLERNPGLSYVACVGGEIVGTVLCGHDGRRGLMRHLAVKREFRGRGIAKALVKSALQKLAEQGIGKCNAYVLNGNTEGLSFWAALGWYPLEDNFRTIQARSDLGT